MFVLPLIGRHGETERAVDEASRVRGETAGNGDVGGHFTEGHHDAVNNGGDKAVADEDASRARLGEGTARTDEETSTNSTTYAVSQSVSCWRENCIPSYIPMAIICKWRDLSLRFSSGPALCSAKEAASSSAVDCSLTKSFLVALPGGDPAAEEPGLAGAGGVLSRTAMFMYVYVFVAQLRVARTVVVGRCGVGCGLCAS